jgi:Relaxase/Mobilisation nuclease domain
VIVKKVPGSRAAGAKPVAANVRDLADYIAGPNVGGDGEKVQHRGALNFLNVDHEGQVQEMIDLAEIARRDAKPVQHWILSWREGEQPTAAQPDQAAKMFLAEMDLSDHQAIYALHSDTDNWHLHLAVNRVHQETERVVTVNKGYDLNVAHRAITRIELQQGWQPEGRALYAPGEYGELMLVRGTGPSARQPSARALSFEERVGACSAERITSEDAVPVIRQARSWSEVHEGLAELGMRFEKKGSGAVLWVGDQPVKASAAGRDCSMAALQKRLGAFEPALEMPRARADEGSTTRAGGATSAGLLGQARKSPP